MSLVRADLYGHDRAPAIRDREPIPALAGALSLLRVNGAFFLRGEYSEAWAFESMPADDVAAALLLDTERVLLFHVIGSGRCWVEPAAGERLWADAGDVIVLPYGDAHRMGGVQDATCVSVSALIEPQPWSSIPMIRYGQGGAQTSVICGYLSCDDPLFDPRLRVFPPAFVVSPPPGPARDWVSTSITYALAQTAPAAGGRFEAPPHLPQLLLMEVLRLHLDSAPAADRGLVRALRDPVLASVMSLIHTEPDRKWTVAGLAGQAAVSPSLLDERFRDVLGLPPIRYLTGWRMHVARDLLATGGLGIAAIARRVGYDSEEAFSRAFKRLHGLAPGTWRTSVLAGP
jgi:AraC-like DNA-binding protein